MLYFIEKMGVYAHGVFWIGGDLEEGKREADRLASEDHDSYHDWNLKLFDDHACTDLNSDPTHRILHVGIRTEEVKTVEPHSLNNATPLGSYAPVLNYGEAWRNGSARPDGFNISSAPADFRAPAVAPKAPPKVKQQSAGNVIPPMTDPLGRHWSQPDPCAILVGDTYATMSKASYDKLAEYSRSTPSSVYPGKMWKAILSDGSRHLCWYGIVKDNPKVCLNNSRLILIADQPG